MASGLAQLSRIVPARTIRRRIVTYVLLVTASIALMASSTSGPLVELQKGIGFAFRPMEVALTSVAQTGASVVSAISEIDQLRRQNAALEAENARLTAETAQSSEIERQNTLLTGLLQLKNSFQYKTVAAAVIARDASDFRRVITIDVGSNQGIREGDVVIAAGGALAGRVMQVGPDASNVLLINDTASIVVGQIQSNGATGEVAGQLGGVLVMADIDATQKVVVGDEVVTAGIALSAGLRSPYPKGLVIGVVADGSRDPNAVVQTAYLVPTADLDNLEYVLVITDYEGGLEPLVGPSGSPDASGSPGASATPALPPPSSAP